MVEPWDRSARSGRSRGRLGSLHRALSSAHLRRDPPHPAERDDVMNVFAHVCDARRKDDFARLRRCAAHVSYVPRCEPNSPPRDRRGVLASAG